jgi:hypothetical protein
VDPIVYKKRRAATSPAGSRRCAGAPVRRQVHELQHHEFQSTSSSARVPVHEFLTIVHEFLTILHEFLTKF